MREIGLSIDVEVSEMSDVKIEKYWRSDVEGEGVRESEKVSEARNQEDRIRKCKLSIDLKVSEMSEMSEVKNIIKI